MNSVKMSPDALRPLVPVECLHLASVEGPHGTRHHILVDPTSATVQAVREWETSGEYRGISVSDRTGLHTRDVTARVMKTVYSFNTLLITTSR